MLSNDAAVQPAASGAPLSAGTGVRMALEPGRGRTAVPVRTTSTSGTNIRLRWSMTALGCVDGRGAGMAGSATTRAPETAFPAADKTVTEASPADAGQANAARNVLAITLKGTRANLNCIESI